MNSVFKQLQAARALGIVLLVAVGAALPSVATADVERIREMALELEQKLNRKNFEIQAKVDEPTTDRIYKDFDFILMKSKVDEVAAEAGTDPDADRLRLYLTESIVRSTIATYLDDLTDFEQSSTVDYEGTETGNIQLMRTLQSTETTADRRKLYSSLGPFIDTALVFRTEILDRQNKGFKEFGYETYADFYSEREGLDLVAIEAQAQAFLADTQALYDVLLAMMAERHLGVEARKVRFYDLPYVVNGSFFQDSFPASDRNTRLRSVFRGLGINLREQNNVDLDTTDRPGKRARTRVYPVEVPNDIRVSVDPVGGMNVEFEVVYGTGLAQIFALSAQTTFETAYLVNQAARDAMAFVPRLVLDEPAWVAANWAGDDAGRGAYLEWRAFAALYEARMLAALAILESHAYRGGDDVQSEFRDVVGLATGARISSLDSKRTLAFIAQMENASLFKALLLAYNVREHLRSQHGEAWFQDGVSSDLLRGLWARGGTLTTDDISAAAGSAQPDPAALVRAVEALVAAAAGE